MFIKDLNDCEEFVGKDDTILRQLLHPDKDPVNIRYSMVYALLPPGKASRPHKLKTSEVYYILEGRGIMHINNESNEVHSGQVIYIPPFARQWIENKGDTDLKFLCIVDPAWHPENEEII